MEELFYAKAAGFIGAAIAMGIGSIGPALGQGLIGMKACESMAKEKDPETASKIRNTMMIAMGLVETSAIYAFIIAIWLIIVASKL